jgi:hypothetical protein
MLLDLFGNDTVLGLWLAQQLQRLQTGTPYTQVGLTFQGLVDANIGQTFLAGDATGPTMWAYRGGGYVLVMINCTETLTQAIGLWNSYTEPVGDFGRFQNGYMFARSLAMRNYLVTWMGPGTAKYIVCGHSQGGALAWILANQLNSFATATRMTGVSFGAPKPAINLTTNVRNRTAFGRYMNTDDPVPLVPPSTILPAQMIALGIPGVARRLVTFRQPQGGMLIGTDNSVIAGELPAVATLPAIANFAGWLLNANQGSVAAHQLNTYIARLTAYNASIMRRQQETPPQGPATPAVALTRAEVAAGQRAGRAAVFAVGEAQQAPPLKIPAAELFSAFGVNGIWYVALSGSTIAVGPTKKRARAMKNFGNALLKRLQRAGYVDVNTLLAQMGLYFAAAQTRTGMFVPPMQVLLPS